MASIKLGELLVKAQVLQESQLKSALAEQKRLGGKLGEVLIRMSLVTEDLLTRALSRQLNVPVTNLDTVQALPAQVRDKITLRLAKDLLVVPLQLRDDGKTLIVAMAEPTSSVQLEVLRGHTRLRILAHLSSPSAIRRAIGRFYEGEGDFADVESSFKLIDSQGRTLEQPRPVLEPQATARREAEAQSARQNASTASALDQLEQIQRQEVTMLKAMVELLIQKGVFTRDEYLAKLKR